MGRGGRISTQQDQELNRNARSLFPSSACPRASWVYSPSVTSTHPSRSRRTSFATRSPDGTSSPRLRPDPARRYFAIPIVERLRQSAIDVHRRWFSYRRASSPRRSRSRSPRSRRAASRSRRSTGASDPRAGQARSQRACGRRDAGASQRSARAQGNHARCHSHPRPRRGRPDARHGLQAAGRPHRATASFIAPDHVLLRDARWRVSESSLTRIRAIAVRCEAAPIVIEASEEVEHRFVSVNAEDKVSTLAELLREERGVALVFVERPARCGTPRQEARVPPGRRRRIPRRPQSGTAGAGAEAVRDGQGVNARWRRMSRLAGLISSTSRT